MKISSRGRYAVRVMAELAKRKGEFVSALELSNAQGISVKYTEKIISALLKANLLESVRGATGGYRLTRAPEEYGVREILGVTDDLPRLAPCLEKGCERRNACPSVGCWEKLGTLITDYLEGVRLSDLLN